jgi:putative DNA primase/helicase
MMSNLCPVEYEPNATHQVWTESIAAFTRNHPNLPGFLQRIAGYSIQGDKSEERIFLLYGPGNAGKGTFMDWLTNALGPDYACAMDANSALKQKRDSAAASGDIARLEGKRIVVVSEIEKGSRVQESFMKQASGNDALVARSLYQSEREFRPTHQFWFQTNYRPGFDSTDSGNKRRYVEIPFDNDLKIDPQVKFDAKLKIRMRQDAAFLKAVLAWCIQGCIEWRQHGLDIPESVTNATAQLFAHNDFLRDFLSEMCIADPSERVTVKDLQDAYKRWCEGQGEEPAQGRTFNRMMEERGFERKQARIHGVNGKAWSGIRLKTHDELVARLPEAGSQEDIEVPAGNVKRFPARQKYTTVFGGKTMVG